MKTPVTSWVLQYAVAAVAFCVLDLVWLSFVGKDLYDERLGSLLAEEPNAGAAVLFYALFVAGLVHFVVRRAGSLTGAVLDGGFFGLVAYATFDLTGLAVLRDFPASVVVVDLVWGTFLAGVVCGLAYAVVAALPSRAT
ncbi:DUF2177 family protein [Nocardioides sp. MAHUQ-72]|uniref:DUF2177 family protein n=1 Tax=unclassified Nocardioides TaxID=2615069 RepID=UPI003618ADB9